MSWWDPKGFSSLASQAFKTAQKQIDKVLDIDEHEDSGKSKTSKATDKTSALTEAEGDNSAKEESNSWNSWGSWMASSKPGGEEINAPDSSTNTPATSLSPSSFGAWVPHEKFDDQGKQWDLLSGSATLPIKGQSQPASSKIKPSSAACKLDLASRQKEREGGEDKECTDDGEDKAENEVGKGGEQGGNLLPWPSLSESSANAAGTGIAVKGNEDGVSNLKQDRDGTERLETLKTPDQDNLGMAPVIGGSDFGLVNSLEGDVRAEEENLKKDLPVELSSDVSDSETISAVCPKKDSEVNVTDTVSAEKDLTDSKVSEGVEECRTIVMAHSAETSRNIFTSNEWDQTDLKDEVDGADSNIYDSSVAWVDKDGTGFSSMSSSMEVHDILVGTLSCDTLVAGESNFSQILSAELAQQISMSSASSEPVHLYITADDSSTGGLLQESVDKSFADFDVLKPSSHSSSVAGSESGSISEEVFTPETSSTSFFQRDDPTLSTSSFPSDSSTTMASSNDSSEATVIEQSLPQPWETDSGDEAEEAGIEDSGSQQWVGESDFGDFEPAVSPSASFVKCMIEDAMGMEDSSAKHETDSGSSEEKSEGSKVDSEFEKSIYSGQESSDEIETTTSSDIEIISTPTPNGEKNIVDLSPLRFSLQKAARNQAHQRTDSQSSSSTHSKGDGDHLSPERDTEQDRHDWHPMGKSCQQHPVAVQDDELDNPHHPQRLLKNSKNQQDKDIVKKLAEMAEVLQARERQLVQLSKDNNDLMETNSILRGQLQQAEEARESEMTDLNALTEEFTRRMGESERKLQGVIKEKEGLKQQLQIAQKELSKRSEDANLEVMLAEKDEQIQGLLVEGEKLSKQHLQNSTIIKKLRAKEKENESLVTSQKKKMEQQKEELEKLKVVLDSKEDLEKKQTDAIKQLNLAVQAMEKENAKLKAETDMSEEKIRGLQTTLDNSYKEITELHKSNASQDSRAQQAALSAEMQVREELKMAIEQQTQQHMHEKEGLIMQIEDLRLSLSRMEKEHNWREEILKQENSDLQMRLQEDESRTQDVTQSITSATRPLLRQIENLQATHNIQSAAWEKVERTLSERLSDAQTLLALAQEKERAATEHLREVSSRCTALEASNSQLRHEKAQLAAQHDNSLRRMELLEERKASETAQLELAKQKLSDEVASLRKDKVFLEQHLEMEHSRLETERQRVAVAEEQIRILERERPRSRGTPSPVSVSRQESINSSFTEHSVTPTWFHRGEDSDSAFISVAGPKTSLYESMRHTGAASMMENLQSQLKLREGEISQLQADIQQLERTRESMARELVNLTNLNEELQEEVDELPKMRIQFKELDSRYNALLQMYGEKEEKVQELMLDLEDVKEMYKQQINSLMK